MTEQRRELMPYSRLEGLPSHYWEIGWEDRDEWEKDKDDSELNYDGDEELPFE